MTNFREKLPHSAECLKDIFIYDAETGFLHWRHDRGGRTKAGDKAGTITPNGYVKIRFEGVGYFAHRIVWAINSGAWPLFFIDHIDGNRTNNRLENIRAASPADNQQNKVKKGGSSKYLGVHWNKKKQKWRASIGVNKKCIWIGDFSSEEEAFQAYLQRKSKLHSFQPLPRNVVEVG